MELFCFYFQKTTAVFHTRMVFNLRPKIQLHRHDYNFFPFSQAATNHSPVATTTSSLNVPKINPNSRWSKIKIVTKQSGDECITAIEIVPPVEGAERHSIPICRPRTVARKFASIARSQMKRKRQMAAREKKV